MQVRTIDLGAVTLTEPASSCSGQGFEIVTLAAEQIAFADFRAVSGPTPRAHSPEISDINTAPPNPCPVPTESTLHPARVLTGGRCAVLHPGRCDTRLRELVWS